MRKNGKKLFSLCLALLLALGLVGPIRGFAVAPTSIEAVTATAPCSKWPEGETQPEDLTFTTANIFSKTNYSNGYIRLEVEGLPDNNGRSWYCTVTDDAGRQQMGNISTYDGTSYIRYRPDAAVQGALTLTLSSIRSDYTEASAAYVFGPVTISTYFGTDDELPAFPLEQMGNRFFTCAGYSAGIGMISLPAVAPQGLIARVVRDGVVYAGTDLGYNVSQRAYMNISTKPDPRYEEIFSDASIYMKYTYCSPYIYTVRKLTAGSYDILLLNEAGETVYTLPDALTVTDMPCINTIQSASNYSGYQGLNNIGAREALIYVVMFGGDPADFTVALYDGETLLGTSDAHKTISVSSGSITEIYRIPLSAPIEGNHPYTARLSSEQTFEGTRESSIVFYSGNNLSILLDSPYYADFMMRGAIPSDVTIHAELSLGGATLSETDFRMDENGAADVEFCGADGMPVALEMNGTYNVSLRWTIGYGTHNAAFSFSTSGMRTTPSSSSSSGVYRRGGFSQAGGGHYTATVCFPDTDAEFAAMTDRSKYTLRLTSRLGEVTLIPADTMTPSANGNEIRRDIRFAADVQPPQAYYTLELLYDGEKLLDKDGKNILGATCEKGVMLYEEPYASIVMKNRAGMYISAYLNTYNVDSTLRLKGYFPGSPEMIPELDLTATRGSSGRYELAQTPTPAQMRERYVLAVTADDAPIASDSTGRYVVPEAVLNAAASDTFTVTADTASHGTISLISCPTGETAASGDALPAYSEVYVRAVPEEGYRLKTGSIRVNGVPISGRAFLLTEDSAVTAEFEAMPAVYRNLSLYSYIYNGTLTLNAASAAVGSKVTVTPTPNSGYLTSSVQYSQKGRSQWTDILPDADGIYSFEMPDYDVEVKAQFKRPTSYKIWRTYWYAEVEGLPDNEYENSVVSFRITKVYDGHRLDRVKYRRYESDEDYTILEPDESGTYRFVMPSYAVELVADMTELPMYYIKLGYFTAAMRNAVRCYEDGVELDKSGYAMVMPGCCEFSIDFSEWTDSGVVRAWLADENHPERNLALNPNADGTSWSILLPEEGDPGEHAFYVSVETAYPNSAVIANYCIHQSGAQYATSYALPGAKLTDAAGNECNSFLPGRKVYFEPGDGAVFAFDGITINGDPADYELSEDGRYCFTMPDTYVNLQFRIKDFTYYTVSANAGNGSIAFGNYQTQYRPGSTVSFTVTPYDGWTLSGVSAATTSGAPVQLTQTEGGYSFIMPSENVSVTAEFAENFATAPGGEVRDNASLFAALGGEANAEYSAATGNAVMLNSSIALETPLRFTAGDLHLQISKYDAKIHAPAGESALIVDGGTLELSGKYTVTQTAADADKPLVLVQSGKLSINPNSGFTMSEGAAAPAIRVTGGVLLARKYDYSTSPLSVAGGNSAAALEVAGGSVRLEDGVFFGGGADTAAVLLDGGKLEITGGTFEPMGSSGSALRMRDAAAELTLRGGSFFCGKSHETQPATVVAPSVALPEGKTLASVLGRNCVMRSTENAAEPIALTEAQLAGSSVAADITIADETKYYRINYGSGNVTFRVSDDLTRAEEGTPVSFTVVPGEGWLVTAVEAWKLTAASMEPLALTEQDGVYSFLMPACDVGLGAKVETVKYPAPGGVVTDYASLLTALGGEENARLLQAAAATDAGTAILGVELKRNLALQDTLRFTGGELALFGAELELARPAGKSAITVERGATLELRGRLRIPQTSQSTDAMQTIEVSGGTLSLYDAGIHGQGASCDAIRLSDGVLIVNESSFGPYLYGSGTGCGLNITGGHAIVFGSNSNIGGGSAGNKAAAAAPAADGDGGDGIRVSGGVLDIYQANVNPGYPNGSALTVSGKPTVTLYGGNFYCITSWDSETQTSTVTHPSIRLPAGMTLADLLGKECSITLFNTVAEQLSEAQALASGEVWAGVSVLPSAAAPTPLIPAAVSKEEAVVVFQAAAPAGSTVTAALYDKDGRFLECALVKLETAKSSVTLHFSGKSDAAVSAGIFLSDSKGGPICTAAFPGLNG